MIQIKSDILDISFVTTSILVNAHIRALAGNFSVGLKKQYKSTWNK